MIIAWIDLTSGRTDYSETDQQMRERFLGGRGLGAKILFDHVGPKTGPFDPENYLIFTTGPFNGTIWPSASRYHVTFKSPATNAYGYANAGGHFGPELARAGFEALVVTGHSSGPVYLQVEQEKVVICPADHLWGKGTYQVQDILLGSDGANGKNGRVLCIGPAGERRVRIAAIINDYGRAAARGGPGAVMGSKNLKAIHVRSSVRRSSDRDFIAVAKEASKQLLSDPREKNLREIGTIFLNRIKNLVGDFPAKNHQRGQVPFIDAIDSDAFSRYKVRSYGCAVCPVHCSRISAIDEGPYASRVEGPEYETSNAFGPMVWNDDPQIIIRANFLCNHYGLDTISTGVVIAFAMECHENGLLDDPELSLDWGDPVTILGLIDRIGTREGIGDILAEGVWRASDIIGNGADAFGMHVKGLEIPRQEPRISKGFGLGHATSNRGADHLYGLPSMDLAGNWQAARHFFPEDILEKLMDSSDETYKADILVLGENYCAVTDSLGICKFTTTETYVLMPDDLSRGLQALGVDLNSEALLEIGERIVNLERLFNIREGLKRSDDQLPLRFTEESLSLLSSITDEVTGETKLGEEIAVAKIMDFAGMLDRYYSLRGWDAEGKPTKATVDRLGLMQES
jgi:aldehyde:ferredoxin oxidoreductase